ncbi:MAG: hypothetical protein QM817_06900 [Archangium sp.]
MRHLLIASLLVAAPVAFADEIVNSAPSNAELGRYTVVRTADTTARLDTATGAVWFMCTKKTKAAWCKAKDIPSLPAGPVGRYKSPMRLRSC